MFPLTKMSLTNKGKAVVVADVNGFPKHAEEVYTKGHLSNGRHAKIKMTTGDYLVVVKRRGDDITSNYYQLNDELLVKVPYAELLELSHYAAVEKSKIYHCREAVFIKT